MHLVSRSRLTCDGFAHRLPSARMACCRHFTSRWRVKSINMSWAKIKSTCKVSGEGKMYTKKGCKIRLTEEVGHVMVVVLATAEI